MKIKELGEVKEESVFIQEGFRLWDACDSQQETALFTRESTAMISLNIFQDIMASCRVSIKILILFAEQSLHNT